MVNDNTGWLYLKYITNNESMNQGYPEKEMPSSVLGSQGRHPFHSSSDILKIDAYVYPIWEEKKCS